jgi:hypothetical protein
VYHPKSRHVPTPQCVTRRILEEKRKAAGLCTRCGSQAVTGMSLCELCRARANATARYRNANREKCRETERRYWKTLRQDILNGYGSECACCQERTPEFLTLDHVHGNGAAHRREVGQKDVYRIVRQQGYPADYRLLCMNCNFARSRYGECPHERDRRERKQLA